MKDRPRRGGLPPPVQPVLASARARARGDPAVGMPMDAALAVIREDGGGGDGWAGGLGAAPDLLGDVSERAWSEVFEERVMVPVGPDRFCCYTAGLPVGEDGIVCVLLHGGGHCGLSWGMVSAELKGCCGVIAYDARGHGESRCEDEGDLSAEVQVADAAAVVEGVFAGRRETVPSLVIVGHSMGGAIAVRLAASHVLRDVVKGLVVIDVVEGTAMAALPHMRAWLAKRKESFRSIESGVRYVVGAGHVRNVASARLSVPRELEYRASERRWVWRTALGESAQYWGGWFAGLSRLFLSVPAAKMLVLAGVDRLDKDLMIAQMQGKFQNMVIPGAGHVVHEDRPGETADVLLEYLRRNMFISAGSLGPPSIPRYC